MTKHSKREVNKLANELDAKICDLYDQMVQVNMKFLQDVFGTTSDYEYLFDDIKNIHWELPEDVAPITKKTFEQAFDKWYTTAPEN